MIAEVGLPCNRLDDVAGTMPGDRCGYTYDAQEYPDLGHGCCWRPVWGDTDRCIWHADVARKPVEELKATAPVPGERLDGAVLTRTTLDDVDWLHDTVLVDADFQHASAEDADFSGADLRNANFDDASLRGTDFSEANVEDALLCDTDLKGASFADARLHEADFSRSFVGRRTVFGTPVVYEEEFERAESPEARRRAFDAATWTYRTLQYLCRENGLIDRTEEFFVREKDLRRRFAWKEDDYFHALRAEGSRFLMGYGYSIGGLLVASIVVVLLGTLLYPLLGGVHEPTLGEQVIYALDFPPDRSFGATLTVYGKSLYFSLMSFTTLGTGDVRAGGYLAQLLSVTQALLGYVLLALLISVLARRRYWL